MEQILIKKIYKLIDEELFEKVPGLEPLDSVCINIKDNQSNPVYTFAYRVLKDVNGKMPIRKTEIKSVEKGEIRYIEDANSGLAQLAYKGSPNEKCGDKLYSLLEKYLREAEL